MHVTLALFLSTFVYALTVLRTVRSPDEQQDQFVPQISVTLAFVLAVASVVTLVLFLAHLAREIRVETMLRTVHEDASATVGRLLPDVLEDGPGAQNAPTPPRHARLLLAPRSGFLTAVDLSGLADAAADHDAVVLIDQLPGGFVAQGTPLGCCWSRTGSGTSEVADTMVDAVPHFLTVGVERTDTQDFAFGLRQMVDVAAKALSPGVNDPTTAIHALGHISSLLCELAGRDLSAQLTRDRDGHVRVVRTRPGFDVLLEEGIAQPRRYGAADPAVVTRLLGLLREVAWSTRDDNRRRSVRQQLDRLRATIATADFDPTERARLDRDSHTVEDALEGRWPFAV